MPYVNSGLPGLRWARFDVYEHGAAVYQQYTEDRLHSSNFGFVFRPGDVEKIEFVPTPRATWRMFTDAKQYLHVPRVVLHVSGAKHQIAMLDGKFKRNVGSGLDLLARALRAEVVR